jgi:hypothetical protein
VSKAKTPEKDDYETKDPFTTVSYMYSPLYNEGTLENVHPAQRCFVTPSGSHLYE